MSERKRAGSIEGRGYYIALILCAAAIGITGYLYYRNANEKPAQMLDDRDAVVNVMGTEATEAAVLDPANKQNQATRPQPSVPETKPSEPLQTMFPVAGQTVAEYAMDCLSYNETTRDWRVHNGMDIAADAGTAVCAAAAGTVYTTYDDDTMGTTVVIRHADGYTTKYASLAPELTVSAGDTVKMGQPIGAVGNTALLESAIGDHVHFSVTCNDAAMDPAEFLKQD